MKLVQSQNSRHGSVRQAVAEWKRRFHVVFIVPAITHNELLRVVSLVGVVWRLYPRVPEFNELVVVRKRKQ
jgi:hypothetical protein